MFLVQSLGGLVDEVSCWRHFGGFKCPPSPFWQLQRASVCLPTWPVFWCPALQKTHIFLWREQGKSWPEFELFFFIWGWFSVWIWEGLPTAWGLRLRSELSGSDVHSLHPEQWWLSHSAHVETLVSPCVLLHSDALSSVTSKASRNREGNLGLAKRRSRKGWPALTSSAVGAQGWWWGCASLAPAMWSSWGCGQSGLPAGRWTNVDGCSPKWLVSVLCVLVCQSSWLCGL